MSIDDWPFRVCSTVILGVSVLLLVDKRLQPWQSIVMTFDTFEHTADVGIRIESPELAPLFADGGRGLCSILVENPESVKAVEETLIEISGNDVEFLLHDWLSELLYRFDVDGLLLSQFDIQMTADGLAAKASGERFDPGRHISAHEIKAVTYHELCVRHAAGGWEATVILDI